MIDAVTFMGHSVEFDHLCPRCHRTSSQPDDASNWWCDTCQQWFHVCERCGVPYTAPMSPFCKDRHEAALTYHPFIAYFDFALGEQVDSLAQRKRFMREKHLDYRDKMKPGDLSARRDRVEQQKREQTHG